MVQGPCLSPAPFPQNVILLSFSLPVMGSERVGHSPPGGHRDGVRDDRWAGGGVHGRGAAPDVDGPVLQVPETAPVAHLGRCVGALKGGHWLPLLERCWRGSPAIAQGLLRGWTGVAKKKLVGREKKRCVCVCVSGAGLGAMGFGLPAALGAAATMPGVTVLDIDGTAAS